MQQMLFCFVRIVPDCIADRSRRGSRLLAERLHPNESLQGVEAASCLPPFLLAVPRKARSKILGGAPAVGVAETSQYRARTRQAQRFDQLAPQYAQCHGIE